LENKPLIDVHDTADWLLDLCCVAKPVLNSQLQGALLAYSANFEDQAVNTGIHVVRLKLMAMPHR